VDDLKTETRWTSVPPGGQSGGREAYLRRAWYVAGRLKLKDLAMPHVCGTACQQHEFSQPWPSGMHLGMNTTEHDRDRLGTVDSESQM
jgi:hypothetical protein